MKKNGYMLKKRKIFKSSKLSLYKWPLFGITLLSVVTLGAIPFFQKKQQLVQNASTVSGPVDGYGLYESCVPYGTTNSCLGNLDTIAKGGFKLVVNYNQMWGNPIGQTTYLNRANTDGMKVIFALNDPAFWNGTNLKTYYPDMGSACGCSDNTGFMTYLINLVKNSPGLWGYYIADEVDPTKHTQVKAFADLVHQLDPNHPRLLVLGSDDTTVNPGLNTLADTADVLGQDYYPVGAPYQPLSGTTTVAQQVQGVADKNGKESAMVLQAHSLGEYDSYSSWCSPFPSCMPYPTEQQMQAMRDLVLQNAHPRMILWYSYFDLVKSDNYTKHWNDLVAAIGSAPIISQAPSVPSPTITALPTPTIPPVQTPTNTPVPTKPVVTVAPPPVQTGNAYWIYKNTLAAGWQDWSWNSTTNFTDTSLGIKTIAWTPQAAYAGFYVHTYNAVNTSKYSSLTFTVQASANNQNLQIGLVGTSEQLLTYVPLAQLGRNPVAGSYTSYTIPLKRLKAANKPIRGFEILNETTTAQPPLYIANIGFK